ncbi:MAG: beta-propeller fold lactonase family protein, partial [Methylococcaceae bacterium]|nr:beta-propeller fold lactonase family protein [Methylococcaceae bacterium]
MRRSRLNSLAALFGATSLLPMAATAAPFAYISNQLADTVAIVDMQAAKVVETLSVEGKPAGVAVSPDGRRVYVSTPESGAVAVI